MEPDVIRRARSRRGIIHNAVIVVMAVCAVTVAALLVQREFMVARQVQVPSPPPPTVLPDSVWHVVSTSGTLLGPRSAPVKIAVFFDYECSFCRQLQPVLDTLRARYVADVAIVHRHYPLTQHPGAYSTAIAAECANAQGRFQAYHDGLFAQDLLGSVDIIRMARDVGIPDVQRFSDCVSRLEPAELINADTTLASELGLVGVPTMIVEGKVYAGVLGIDELDAIVHQELAAHR